MKTTRRPTLCALLALLSILLTACSMAPVATRSPYPMVPPAPPLQPAPPGIGAAADVGADAGDVSADTGYDPWARLREGFEMADCEGDPAIRDWARRLTRNPKVFESRMGDILPRLDYVRQVAAEHGVPSEFALLPWVESSYQTTARGQHGARGMWQIVPATARSMRLDVSKGYDGRLDMAASTEAVMNTLEDYRERFDGDWRLVDYAFNIGVNAMRGKLHKHGQPPGGTALPHIPVRQGTREHLTKMLAMACVIRQPARFGVHLPPLDDDSRLVTVPTTSPLSLDALEHELGTERGELRALNAGWLQGRVDHRHASGLLMPRRHRQHFAASLHEHPQVLAVTAAKDKHATHVVRRGESLAVIARHYDVSVDDLKAWNDLSGNKLDAGQELRVTAL